MTEEKQGAAEWLREISDGYEAEVGPLCGDMVELFGLYCCESETCQECRVKMMRAIADRIDAERALPEGIEWPRFEGGELVKVGDEVELEGKTAKVLDVAFNAVMFSLGVGTAATSWRAYCDYGERVKRPTPKVLDADGVPIEVGDTVWCDDGDEPLRVTLIHTSGYRSVSLEGKGGEHYSLDPERLTHERPDSWEKLEEDARKTACDYAPAPRDEDGLTTCYGCPFQKSESCSSEMTLDVVERAKKLAGIKDGGSK